MSGEIFGMLVVTAILLAALGEWIYKSFYAPQFRVKAVILEKGIGRGTYPTSKGGWSSRCFYWCKVQNSETKEEMKLGMSRELYDYIEKEGIGVSLYIGKDTLWISSV